MSEGLDYDRESSADIMTAPESHGSAARYRPRRGQAYVLREPETGRRSAAGLFLPDGNPRDTKIHRGTIVALGPPSRLTELPSSPCVPWGCEIGDRVYFVFAVWLERMRSFEITGYDGEIAIVAQAELQGVEE